MKPKPPLVKALAGLNAALKALLRSGCDLTVAGEPLGIPDPLLCRRIIERHGTVIALKPEVIEFNHRRVGGDVLS